MSSTAAAQIFRYHEASKHYFERHAASPGALDWANLPNPFRFYDGITPFLLPLLKKDPEGAHLDLYERGNNYSWDLTVESVAAFLELSLGLSAKKSLHGSAWSLRMNPSSGNLHPTEAYLLLPPMKGAPSSASILLIPNL